jgi:hypothetical protein
MVLATHDLSMLWHIQTFSLTERSLQTSQSMNRTLLSLWWTNYDCRLALLFLRELTLLNRWFKGISLSRIDYPTQRTFGKTNLSKRNGSKNDYDLRQTWIINIVIRVQLIAVECIVFHMLMNLLAIHNVSVKSGLLILNQPKFTICESTIWWIRCPFEQRIWYRSLLCYWDIFLLEEIYPSALLLKSFLI